MLIWHEKLYIDTSVTSQDLIRENLDNGRAVPGIYLITLSSNPCNLLDIVPGLQLQQERIRRKLPVIVGLALGRQNAIRLACRIIMEVYSETGDFRVRSWLLHEDP